jgi:hypothetical protein
VRRQKTQRHRNAKTSQWLVVHTSCWTAFQKTISLTKSIINLRALVFSNLTIHSNSKSLSETAKKYTCLLFQLLEADMKLRQRCIVFNSLIGQYPSLRQTYHLWNLFRTRWSKLPYRSRSRRKLLVCIMKQSRAKGVLYSRSWSGNNHIISLKRIADKNNQNYFIIVEVDARE